MTQLGLEFALYEKEVGQQTLLTKAGTKLPYVEYVESEYVAFILPPCSIAHFIDLRELILKFKSHCSENPKPLGAEHAKNEGNHF